MSYNLTRFNPFGKLIHSERFRDLELTLPKEATSSNAKKIVIT